MPHLVQMGSQTTELEQRMFLQFTCQLDVFEVVEAVDGVAKGFVVLLLDEQAVVSLIDGLNVQLNGRGRRLVR